MDPAYFSGIAALAGSLIGGVTSLGASWLSQRAQFAAQQAAHNLSRREDLYKDFIAEASKWYADAVQHNKADTANLIDLYAMVSRMRVLSSPTVADSAQSVVRMIIRTYRAPNRDLLDLAELEKDDLFADPLREFGNACREERWHSRPS